ATDKDTDQASNEVDLTAAVSFLDDHPTVTLTANTAPSLTTDDDTLGTDTDDFSGLFSAAFGNDGEGPAGVTYALGINSGSTGLRDCATGDAILLKMDGSDVVGYVGTNTEVFRISVDGDGNVTLSQSRAIEHIVSGVPTDSALTLASANLITLTATAEDGDKDTASNVVNIGTSFHFADAQPEFTDAADDMTLLFAAGSTQTETYAVDYHNDTPGSVAITADSLVYDGPFTPVVNGNTISFYEGATLIYHLNVTDTGYTVTVDHDPAPTFTDLNFGAVKSGGPQETLSVPLSDNSDTIVFDGLIDGAEWTSSDRDYLNPDSLGFGVKGGQASQINPHEGFLFYNTSSDAIDTMRFGIQGIGNLNTVTVHYQLYNDPNNTPTNHADDVAISGGSGDIVVSGLAGGNIVKFVDIGQTGVSYDEAVVTFIFPGTNDNQGVRVLDFSTQIENAHISDSFSFDVTATDCDLDTVSSGQINVTLDPFLI
ncbi:MAG: DUF5801 repeats-in-toxin domain-containing protein, partial [Ignavibacteriales bacterium]